jgi:hypothetical protein
VTGGRFPLTPKSWYPHASIAYGVTGPARANQQSVKALLSDHPGQPVVLRADSISLVAQSHDRQHITWEHLANVRLNGG